MNFSELFVQATPYAAVAVPGIPAALVPVFGLRLLASSKPPSERFTGLVTLAGLVLGFLASVVLCVAWVDTVHHAVEVPLFHVRIASQHGFEVTLLVDALSLTMMFVTSMIALLVGRFSFRYLHREAGFHRYFILLNVFVAGMQLLVLAGTYDLLFVGWELVGLSSILLIAYFRHRPGPVRGGMHAMVAYRATDVGLLVAAVVVHHVGLEPTFVEAFGRQPWPPGPSTIPVVTATLVASLLLVSVSGKSALFPVGGWLPRAMEGPTPSSALFYGALSVHAGVYLLLRSAPLFITSRTASVLAFVLGLGSALIATTIGRVQADAKNRLAFATMAQVGLMVAAVGLHLFTWVIVHMVAHLCLRLYQLLRAPSALRDAQEMRAALAELPPARPSLFFRMLSEKARVRLYHLALHRFHMDDLLSVFVVRPVVGLSARINRFEDAIADTFEPSEPRGERKAGTAEGAAQS